MMTHQLNFNTSYRFPSTKGGIVIPVELIAGGVSVNSEAKVDTGAEYCLFERDVAESLMLNVESGQAMKMEALTGSFLTYGHEVTLQTFDLAFDVTVYFAADYRVARNLLGRNGWLNLVRLGLNSYDEILYVSAYDDL